MQEGFLPNANCSFIKKKTSCLPSGIYSVIQKTGYQLKFKYCYPYQS